MSSIHVAEHVVVSAPPSQGNPHALAGKEGVVTAVRTSLGTAHVLFPGMKESIQIPLTFLEPVVDTKVLMVRIGLEPTDVRPSRCEDFDEYQELVLGRQHLQPMTR